LRPATRDIFILLSYEIQIEKTDTRNKSRKVSYVKNRDAGVVLPYDNIKERLGYSHKTIWTAFRELFEHGFIDTLKMGGGCKGDHNVYKICEDWRKWEPGQIVRTMPDKNIKFGWQQKKNKLNQSKPTTLNQSKPGLVAINE
jgi:hypothetical protein